MGNIHYNVAVLKTRVSPTNFLKIISSVGLPLTTIQLVDPAKQNADMDSLRVYHHMPDPARLTSATKATRLLAAMVRFQMQNCLLTVTNTYSLTKCEQDFSIGRSEFERVVTGKKRIGGHEYKRRKLLDKSEYPTGSFKPKTKKTNPVDKCTRGSGSGQIEPTVCKYCGKLCHTPDSLSVHINNEHPKDQSYFMCTFCARNFNNFTIYLSHLNKHSKDMIRCHICKQQFDDPHSLRVHANEHSNQCPLCSRSFKSKQGVTDHINSAHGKALTELVKRCDYCNVVFDDWEDLTKHCGTDHRYFQCDICFAGFVSETELLKHKEADHPEGRCNVVFDDWEDLTKHCGTDHRYFQCDICFAGFVSETELLKHKEADHPEGRPGDPGDQMPSAPEAPELEEVDPNIAITGEQHPEIEEAMKVIATPDLSPFAVWHSLNGQVQSDEKHQVRCDTCSRYLKSTKQM